jgi:hypothetical protein
MASHSSIVRDDTLHRDDTRRGQSRRGADAERLLPTGIGRRLNSTGHTHALRHAHDRP